MYEHLLEQGKKIDEEFVERGLKEGLVDGQLTEQSNLKSRVLSSENQNSITIVMQTVALLSEANHSLEEWDDKSLVLFEFEQLMEKLKSINNEELTSKVDQLDRALDKFDDESTNTIGQQESSRVRKLLDEAAEIVETIDAERFSSQLVSSCHRLSSWFDRAFPAEKRESTRPRVLSAINEAIHFLDKIQSHWIVDIKEMQLAGLKTLVDEVGESDYDALDVRNFDICSMNISMPSRARRLRRLNYSIKRIRTDGASRC